MDEELKPVVSGEGSAPPTTTSGKVIPVKAGTETPQQPPAGEAGEQQPAGAESLQAMIKAEVERATAQVRDEYEAKGTGHISKLKSSYDKQIRDLKRQLDSRQQQEYQQAMELLEGGDFQEAAAILAGQVQALQGQSMADSQRQQMEAWATGILDDLGLDLESDEETAAFAAQWIEKLAADPNWTWDFQQEAGKRAKDTERKRADAAEKELRELKESLPDLIKAEVARAFVSSGLTPAVTGDGGAPGGGSWRNKPAGTLVREGLAARRAAAAAAKQGG
jgi:hypothetical protein